MKAIKFLAYLILSTAIYNIGCNSVPLNSNDTNIEKPKNNFDNEFGAKVENDYLYFRTREDFNKTIQVISKYSNKQKDDFENKFAGFKSIRKQYIDNEIADSLFFAPLEKNPGAVKSLSTIEHCPEIMKTIFMYDKHKMGEGVNNFLLLRNLTTRYASVANLHGIVRVGDTIIQCIHDTLKMLTPARFDKVKLLIDALRDDSSTGITLKKTSVFLNSPHHQPTNCTPPPYFIEHPWENSSPKGDVTFSKKGKLCIHMEIGFANDILNSDCASKNAGEFFGNIDCTRRNILGFWVADPADVTLELYYNTTFNVPNMPSQGLIFSGHTGEYVGIEPNQVSNIQFPEIYAWDYPQNFNVINFHARATRSGGSNGAEINLYH